MGDLTEYNFTIYDETYKNETLEIGKWPLWDEYSIHSQMGGTLAEWQEKHVVGVYVVLSSEGLDSAKKKATAMFESDFDRKVSHVIFDFEQAVSLGKVEATIIKGESND